MKKRKVLLFANTLWFINRFKSSLISDLIKRNYEVNVIYFRKGPIKDTKKLNLNNYSIEIKNVFSFLINQFLKIGKKKTLIIYFYVSLLGLSYCLLYLFSVHIKDLQLLKV